jgi:hypothetical protein
MGRKSLKKKKKKEIYSSGSSTFSDTGTHENVMLLCEKIQMEFLMTYIFDVFNSILKSGKILLH